MNTNTLIKLGLIGGTIGLVYLAAQKAKDVIDKFTFSIAGFGIPTLKDFVLTLPIKIKLVNPTPISVTADNVKCEVFILKNGTYVKGAVINQPFTIAPGVNTIEPKVAMQLKNLFSGNVLNTAIFVADLIGTKAVTIRADYTITVKGISAPMQSYSDTINFQQ